MQTALSSLPRASPSLAWMIGLALLVVLVRTIAATPSPGSLDVETAIELPAQPLSEALRGLAKQANLQILFEPGLVAGRAASALQGPMTPRAALNTLLQGTGLEAYEQAPGVVVIRPTTRVRVPQTPSR